jgi:hypothetical protein
MDAAPFKGKIMADDSDNPYVKQERTAPSFVTKAQRSASTQEQRTTPPPNDRMARPFQRGRAAEGGTANLNQTLQRRVNDVGADVGVSVTPTSRAGDLSVKDLNDLAAEFSGVPSNNPKVSALTIEDINSLEAVFYDVKMNAVRAAREATAYGDREAGERFFDISCCCCTPCCSCAAAETAPFAVPHSGQGAPSGT